LNRYKKIVEEIIQQDERAFFKIMQESLDFIGLSEADFIQVHQTHSEHPAFMQTMVQQQSKSSKLPTIS